MRVPHPSAHGSDALKVLAARLRQWTGLDCQRGGASHALQRYVERRAAEHSQSVNAYVDSLTGPQDGETQRLLNAITVGYTWLFRDPGQLESLASVMRQAPAGQVVNVWVAGCSSGEDAYSVALLAHRERRKAHVRGTDLNSDALDQAQVARYGRSATSETPVGLAEHLQVMSDGQVEVSHNVRAMVQFQWHNLVASPPAPPGERGWDIILCRNVLIYFDADAARAVVVGMAQALAPGGTLFLGSAEVGPPPAGAPLQLRQVGGNVAMVRVEHASPPSTGYQPPPAPAPKVAPPVAVPPPAAAPPSPTPLHLMTAAATLLQQGNIHDAVHNYQRVLDAWPLHAEARLWLGVAHHLEGDARGAVRWLRGALVLEPDLWVASYYLAVNYERLGRPQEAQLEYGRVIEGEREVGAGPEMEAPLQDMNLWREEILQVCRMRLGGRR